MIAKDTHNQWKTLNKDELFEKIISTVIVFIICVLIISFKHYVLIPIRNNLKSDTTSKTTKIEAKSQTKKTLVKEQKNENTQPIPDKNNQQVTSNHTQKYDNYQIEKQIKKEQRFKAKLQRQEEKIAKQKRKQEAKERKKQAKENSKLEKQKLEQKNKDTNDINTEINDIDNEAATGN